MKIPPPPPRCSGLPVDGERCCEVLRWCLPVDVELFLAIPRYRPAEGWSVWAEAFAAARDGDRWRVVETLNKTRAQLQAALQESAHLWTEIQVLAWRCPC